MNCQYLNAVASQQRGATLMKSILCNKPANKTGFCAEHQYCYEVLELGRALDFPPYVIASIGKEAIYTIAAGPSAWKGYAVRHPLRHHSDLMQRLRHDLKASMARQERQETRQLAEVA